MSVTDMITAIGSISTAGAMIITLIALAISLYQYRKGQIEQHAAQTREDLQAIIGDCGLFLRPLNQSHPYPIFHTVTAITKEFCSRMGDSPRPEDVLQLLNNKDLLLSICVDGWISSTQILHMMDIVEKLERKASSRNLQGRLLIIREASFLLAGIVAEICSPDSFYTMLRQLQLQNICNDEVADILNTITVELQRGICKTFNDEYKDKIERSLYFILTAATMFIGLTDQKLKYLSKGAHVRHFTAEVPEDPILTIKQESSPLSHYKEVKKFLDELEQDIGNAKYQKLFKLIEPLKAMCEQYEILPHTILAERTLVSV